MIITCRNRFAAALGTFCILLSPLLVRAQQTNKQDAVIIPLIKLDDVPFSDAVVNLVRQAGGFNYIVDPHVPYRDFPPLTLTLTNVTATEALDIVLKLRRLVRIESPATSVSRIVPEKSGIKPVGPDQIGNDTNAPCPVVLFEEVPIRSAIQAFADQLHLKITFDNKFMAAPVSKSNVSLRWTNLTLKQALVAFLDNYDLILIPDQSSSNARITLKEEAPKSKSR